MFHHDPTHDDTTLEAMQVEAARLWEANETPPTLAAAGMSIDMEAAAAPVYS